MQALLLVSVLLLAMANGANDNFKGVATLRNSAWFSFWKALGWATAWTAGGSLLSIWLAARILPVFSGAALIPVGTDPLGFLASVACGAAITVLVASQIGMPVSTTHALLGALTGAAIVSAGWANARLASLGAAAAVPLLISPLLAMGITRLTFPLMRRLFPAGANCICLRAPELMPLALAVGSRPSAAIAWPVLPAIIRDSEAACTAHTPDAILRANANEVVHWMSAGGISLSRGMNDTAKIAALLVLPATDVSPWLAFSMVAAGMAAGGLLGARRVARTISERITDIPTHEGTGANLTTALLVMAASPLGLAVSATHVSVGSILGVAQTRGEQTDWGMVWQILLSWLVTLPLGGVLGALIYALLF